MPDTQHSLYALADYRIQPIDAQSIALIRVDNGAAALMDASWKHFLRDLRVFRTLEDHATILTKRFPELQGHEKGLAEGFRQLIPRGILHSSDDVIAQFEVGRANVPDKLKPLTLCIRTCDQPEALSTLLESLRDNARQFQTHWPIEILDDSHHEDSRARNLGLCHAFQPHLALSYLGPREQESFIQQLCDQNPEDTDDLRWLLDANHPANHGQATHGRLYNLAFLLHAGERILLIDDDVRLTAWQWPEILRKPRFHLLSQSGANFSNAEQAKEILQPYPNDPIAAHANFLGLPVAGALKALTEEHLDSALFEGLPLDLVPHPYARIGRIRYTHNGFFGDTGTTSDHNRLFRLPMEMPALLINPDQYRRFREGRRFDFTGSNQPELINGTHFHHTTCAGIDLANLIPPVVPRGRSEDALLASLLRMLYPADYGLCHPFALEHRVHGARPWIFQPEALQQTPDQATALGLWINHLAVPAEVEPAHRLRLLAESIETAERRGVLTKRMKDIIERQANENLAYQFSETRRALAIPASTNRSDVIAIPDDHPWKQDMRKIHQWVKQRLYDPHLRNPIYRELPNLSTEMLRFARALPSWQRAYISCQANP